MLCVKCNSNNTKCIDDMLQVGYVAEIYGCDDCDGLIHVVYNDHIIAQDNIKMYEYISKGVTKRC